MKFRSWFAPICGVCLFLFSTVAPTAVILVAPGDGTLETAVAGANPGDVLELETGMYGGPGFTVGKSLTVRARTASDTPTVALTATLFTGALGTEQTWQRIGFDGMAVNPVGSGSTVTFQGARFSNLNFGSNTPQPSQVRVIESSFTDASIGNCASGFCGTDWTMIGNTIDYSSGPPISIGVSGKLYWLGNDVSQAVPTFFLLSGLDLHIIGNRFALNETTSQALRLSSDPTTGSIRFLGNRVDVRFDTGFGDIVASPDLLTFESCRSAQVRNNLVRVVDTSALSTTTGGSRVSGIQAILIASNCGPTNEISNNIIDFGGFDLGVESAPENGAIHLDRTAVVRTNIFTGIINRPHFTFDPSTVSTNVFEYNLCFNTQDACTSLDGNQDADPLFVNTVDYMLGGGSPAIDAGPPGSAFVIDTDGSRADLGLYGGQFPINQFDIQRTPSRTAPFIYPLFNASQDVDSQGNVLIEVISAARLR